MKKRNILSGNYKLLTNAKLNPEFENLEWNTTIYNDENGKSRDQMYTATNDDVLVSLIAIPGKIIVHGADCM